MGWIFLAVMFYTVVKYVFELWSQFQYEKSETDRNYGFGNELKELKKRVGKLEAV